MPRTLHSLLPAVLACAAFLGSALIVRSATAQPVSIDDRLIRKQEPLTDDEKLRIDAFIAVHKEALEGSDAVKLAKARSALIAPLVGPQVTTSFRIAFSPKALDIANRMFKAGDELHAANALRIAGELATPSAIPLLKDGLAAEKPGVRYAAAFGYARLFESVARTTAAGGTPAPDAAKLKSCIDDLLGLIAKERGRSRDAETDANVIDGAILALAQACRVPDKNAKPTPGQPEASPANSIRGYATEHLAKAAYGLISGVDAQGAGAAAMIPRLLRAATSLRNSLLESSAEDMFELKATHPQAISAICELRSAMAALVARLEKAPPAELTGSTDLVAKLKSAGEQLRGIAECR
ncbi:MAG: hypothetical protein ACT4PL_14170 [Phycisphaerales bacterium]